MRLELDEVRRLTGPNLLWDEPGAILDVFIEHPNKLAVITLWQRWMDKILNQFGWQQTHTYRLHNSGASMALSGPMDALYTTCDLAELAWECCVADSTEQPLPDWQSRLTELAEQLAQERNPRLLTLLSEAKRHHVTAISDDDEFSLGMGPTVQVWPIDALPAIHDVNWHSYKDIPTAFITGTNGKSTSVRLAAEIAKAAKLTAGVTSTDFIRVGEDIIDEGDYSGPGGARMLLRDNRTKVAFLEVARGGILRRGLPLSKVNAALITNVAADHLGQYGIDTVEELAEAKFVVAKGLRENGVLVLNADNQLVVEQAKNVDITICWFSENARHPLILAQIEQGLPAVFVKDQGIYFQHGLQPEHIADMDQIPMTLSGAARHNVQNAMGVIGLCKALNLPTEAIKLGLARFSSSAADNPGRGNLYEVNGVRVMVDFAHNEHSMRAVIATARHLNAANYIVMFSNAGDRSDAEICKLTDAVAELTAKHYIVAEIERYLRGRQPRELLSLVRSQLAKNNIASSEISCTDTPLEGAERALSMAQSGDCVLLFVLDQRQQVKALLDSRQT